MLSWWLNTIFKIFINKLHFPNESDLEDNHNTNNQSDSPNKLIIVKNDEKLINKYLIQDLIKLVNLISILRDFLTMISLFETSLLLFITQRRSQDLHEDLRWRDLQQ